MSAKSELARTVEAGCEGWLLVLGMCNITITLNLPRWIWPILHSGFPGFPLQNNITQPVIFIRRFQCDACFQSAQLDKSAKPKAAATNGVHQTVQRDDWVLAYSRELQSGYILTLIFFQFTQRGSLHIIPGLLVSGYTIIGTTIKQLLEWTEKCHSAVISRNTFQ